VSRHRLDGLELALGEIAWPTKPAAWNRRRPGDFAVSSAEPAHGGAAEDGEGLGVEGFDVEGRGVRVGGQAADGVEVGQEGVARLQQAGLYVADVMAALENHPPPMRQMLASCPREHIPCSRRTRHAHPFLTEMWASGPGCHCNCHRPCWTPPTM